jgi:hypothetical protein
MNIEQYIPYLIQLAITVITFAFILGKYKAAFDHHEKLLDRHDKILDRHEQVLARHEQAIEGILKRLDMMNNDINYLKGYVSAKT